MKRLFLASMGLLAGCGTSHLVTATRLETAGDHRGAADEFLACIDEKPELDCLLGLAQLVWPEGPLADCRKFHAVAKLIRTGYGDDERIVGPHAPAHLSREQLKYPNISSLADWFSRADDVCRARSEDAGDIRDDRQKRVLNNGCAAHRKDPIDKMEPTTVDEIARACGQFLDDMHDGLGIDRETDKAVADSMVLGALTALDDRFVAACRESALRPVCPSESELRKRMNSRLLDLSQHGPAPARLRWSRHFLKRWPDAPEAEKFRTLRERAELDVAMAADPAARADALDAFLAAYPESGFRAEAQSAKKAPSK